MAILRQRNPNLNSCQMIVTGLLDGLMLCVLPFPPLPGGWSCRNVERANEREGASVHKQRGRESSVLLKKGYDMTPSHPIKECAHSSFLFSLFVLLLARLSFFNTLLLETPSHLTTHPLHNAFGLNKSTSALQRILYQRNGLLVTIVGAGGAFSRIPGISRPPGQRYSHRRRPLCTQQPPRQECDQSSAAARGTGRSDRNPKSDARA